MQGLHQRGIPFLGFLSLRFPPDIDLSDISIIRRIDGPEP